MSLNDVYKVHVNLHKHIYNPGDVIEGELELDLLKNLYCDRLTATLHGQVRVFWTENNVSTTSLSRTTAFEQKRQLIEQEKVCWQDSNTKQQKLTLDDIASIARSTSIRTPCTAGEERPMLKQGKHTFPINFTIPSSGLHTSFATADGVASVAYHIMVTAHSFGRVVLKRKHLFPIVCDEPLQENKRVLAPVDREETFTMGKLGAVRVSVSLPHTGYAPGDPIDAVIKIDNVSKKSIKYAHLCVVQRTFCFATEPDFSQREIINKGSGGMGLPVHKVVAGDVHKYASAFNVPALTPNMSIPDCLVVDYRLQLSIGLERNGKSGVVGVVEIPIQIGTQSVHSRMLRGRGGGAEGEREELPPAYQQSSSASEAPPSYEEIMCGLFSSAVFDPFRDPLDEKKKM